MRVFHLCPPLPTSTPRAQHKLSPGFGCLGSHYWPPISNRWPSHPFALRFWVIYSKHKMGWDTALINNFRWLFSAQWKRSNFSGYGNIFNMPPIPKHLRILPVCLFNWNPLFLSGHSFQVILRLLNSQVQRKELMIPTSFVKIHRFLEVCGRGLFFFFFCLFFCISSA